MQARAASAHPPVRVDRGAWGLHVPWQISVAEAHAFFSAQSRGTAGVSLQPILFGPSTIFFSSLFGCPLPVQKSILISGCLGETRWGQLARPTSRGGNRWLELRRQLRLLDKAMRSSFPSTAPLPASHPQPAQSGNLPGSLKCFCVEMSLSALAGAEPVFFLAGQVNSREHNAVVSLP